MAWQSSREGMDGQGAGCALRQAPRPLIGLVWSFGYPSRRSIPFGLLATIRAGRGRGLLVDTNAFRVFSGLGRILGFSSENRSADVLYFLK